MCGKCIPYAFFRTASKCSPKRSVPQCRRLYLPCILHDTGGLARANQGIFQAVADLMAMGVDHGRIMKTLHSDTLDILYKRADILHGAVRAMDGRVAYVIMGQKEIAEKDITYEDIHCISTILRDCDDIELGFTMYEEEENGWRCSFRSDGKWINVNELLKPFGGGGHISAAGLKYRTDNVEELKKQILDRVAEMKNKQ